MIEIALFGAGRIGRIHAANIARLPGVRLRYVADVAQAAAADLAGQHGAKALTDPQEALDDSAVQAVAIASSTDTHADLIQRAAAKKKAIFCEKPVDLDLERAHLCAEAVQKAGVVCMVGFNRRFDPTFAAVKRRLDAGEIGDKEMLIITSRDPAPPPLAYIQVSGGIFKDMLIHDFDIFRWVMGEEAVSVYAAGSCLVDQAIAGAGDADSTAVTLRTASGKLCQINTTRRAAYGYDQRFEVLGSKGMLQAGNHRPTEAASFTEKAVTYDVPEYFFLERYRAAYALEMGHFVGALTAGTPVHTTIEDGVKALALADAATRSWREGRAVEPAYV